MQLVYEVIWARKWSHKTEARIDPLFVKTATC